MPSASALQHDRRAVRVVGADEVHLVPLHPLEAHPDVGLDVFHDVADVERPLAYGSAVVTKILRRPDEAAEDARTSGKTLRLTGETKILAKRPRATNIENGRLFANIE